VTNWVNGKNRDEAIQNIRNFVIDNMPENLKSATESMNGEFSVNEAKLDRFVKSLKSPIMGSIMKGDKRGATERLQ
jgi:hypothetical protein